MEIKDEQKDKLLTEILAGQRVVYHEKFGVYIIKKTSVAVQDEAELQYHRNFNYLVSERGIKSKIQVQALVDSEIKKAGYSFKTLDQLEDLTKKYQEYIQKMDINMDNIVTDDDLLVNCIKEIANVFSEDELKLLDEAFKIKQIQEQIESGCAEYLADKYKLRYLLVATIYTIDNVPLWQSLDELGKETDEMRLMWFMQEKLKFDRGIPSDFELQFPEDIEMVMKPKK